MARTITDSTASAVRAELARRRLSGRDLAKARDWSERTVRRRLAGEVPFTVDELTEVARYLEVSPADLLPRNAPDDEVVPA